MPTDVWLAGLLFASLVAYVLFGGADFGGGVWDLLAWGPRRAEQRRAIAHAIGPIWETNHVWLILAIVLLFTGFPRAFAAISTALHMPLTLFLVGVVLRGSAFAFRGFEAKDGAPSRYGLVFSIASVVSPFLLGAMVAALAAGDVRVQGDLVTSSYYTPWLRPFPLAVGALSLAVCAYLAAVYLTAEVDEPSLREDFRRRALAAGVAVGVTALGALALAWQAAPHVFAALLAWPRGALLQAAAATCALVVFVLLARQPVRPHVLRVAAAAHVVLILVGWALGQHPHLVYPDLTIANAAAHPRARALILTALACGAPILVPSLVLLFRVFKSRAHQSV